MPRPQLYNKPISIRLSERCMKAWLYLQKHKVNAVDCLREGGEKAVINKANEFYYKEKRKKEWPNAPAWLFD